MKAASPVTAIRRRLRALGWVWRRRARRAEDLPPGRAIGGPRHLYLFAAVVAAPLMMVAANQYINATEERIIEREAIKIAEVVASHALATRAVYASVTHDGAAPSSAQPPGPDEFVNRVGEQSRLLASDVYTYRWLPSPSARPAGGDVAWRLGTYDGRRLLRYVRAAPPPMQGAIEVLVPIEQVAAFAAVQTRGTHNLVISLSVFGFTLVTFLAVRAARQQRGLARRYEQLAKIDALTGLANRLEIEQRMQERLALAARSGQGLGVMFVDVDNFKNINDSLGHAAGDQVLQVVAERMSAALREVDLIARYSGDEFVVLLSNISDAAPLAKVAAKLLESVSPVVRVMDNDIFTTLSIGIAYFPTDGSDAATLLKHADTAMYRVKEKGRNGFQFFAAEMNAAALEKLQMSGNLWHALHRNEFLVHYQPKADARTGRVLGFEALVRWNHPDLGILLPGRFIPHAEHSGAIEPLGEWVLRAALAQLREWGGLFEGTMAVNLSMRQLYNPDLPAMVRRMLERHAIPPERLELEVTESMVSLNPEVAAQTLKELSHLGVSIALDDFGTGQSSLSYLLRFPIRTLKIDRSFASGVPECADSCAIVRAVIALTRSLRMRVVAEGVETPDQKAFFQNEGCDEIQGYLVGAPMPIREVTRLLVKTARRRRSSARAAQLQDAISDAGNAYTTP